MTRRLLFAALAVAAWLGAAALGPVPVARRAPPTPAAVLLAPVRPFALAWRWAEAQRAQEEGRPEDALEALRVVESLDPDDARAAAFRAHVVGRDLAGAESSPAAKFALIEEALSALERNWERTRAPEIAFERGRFLSDPWTADVALTRRFESRRRTSPLAAAVVALEQAVAGAPGSRPARALLSEILRFRGAEALTRTDDWDLAVACWRRAADVRDAVDRDVPDQRLAEAWRGLGEAFVRGTAAEIDAATTAWIATLARTAAAGAELSAELYLGLSILPSTLVLGEKRLASGAPRVALSLAKAADSIRRFVDAETSASGPASARENLSRVAVTRLLEGVKRADPATAEEADRLSASLLRLNDR